MLTAASLAEAALNIQNLTGKFPQEFHQSAGKPLLERLAALKSDVDFYHRDTEQAHYLAQRVVRAVETA